MNIQNLDTSQTNMLFLHAALQILRMKKMSIIEFRPILSERLQDPEYFQMFVEYRKLPQSDAEKLRKGLKAEEFSKDWDEGLDIFNRVIEDFYYHLKYDLGFIE